MDESCGTLLVWESIMCAGRIGMAKEGDSCEYNSKLWSISKGLL